MKRLKKEKMRFKMKIKWVTLITKISIFIYLERGRGKKKTDLVGT